jgi:hypothetical protein
MNRIARLIGVTASVTFLAVAMVGSASASAAEPTWADTHVSVPQIPEATPNAVTPDAPAGCNGNNFCEYNKGNGGNLCFQTNANRATWPTACGDHNEGEYNRNGNAVYMYDVANYGDCWYLLYSGHYLLYNANDHFEGGGGNCTSTTLERKLASSKFI